MKIENLINVKLYQTDVSEKTGKEYLKLTYDLYYKDKNLANEFEKKCKDLLNENSITGKVSTEIIRFNPTKIICNTKVDPMTVDELRALREDKFRDNLKDFKEKVEFYSLNDAYFLCPDGKKRINLKDNIDNFLLKKRVQFDFLDAFSRINSKRFTSLSALEKYSWKVRDDYYIGNVSMKSSYKLLSYVRDNIIDKDILDEYLKSHNKKNIYYNKEEKLKGSNSSNYEIPTSNLSDEINKIQSKNFIKNFIERKKKSEKIKSHFTPNSWSDEQIERFIDKTAIIGSDVFGNSFEFEEKVLDTFKDYNFFMKHPDNNKSETLPWDVVKHIWNVKFKPSKRTSGGNIVGNDRFFKIAESYIESNYSGITIKEFKDTFLTPEVILKFPKLEVRKDLILKLGDEANKFFDVSKCTGKID